MSGDNKAALEIVFVDEGDKIPVAPSAPSPGSGTNPQPPGQQPVQPQPSQPSGPSPTPTTGRAKDKDSELSDFLSTVRDAGQDVANVIGVGDIYKQIDQIIGGILKVIESQTTPQPGSKSGPSQDGGGSPAASYNVPDSPSSAGPLPSPQATQQPTGTSGPTRQPPIPMGTVPPPVQAGSPTLPGPSPSPAIGTVTAESAGGLFGKAGSALGKVTSALGPAGTAIAGFTAAAVGGAALLKIAFDTLNSQVEKLQDYSPEVSGAVAMSEVRAEMATMRRAEKIGPDLAGFETTRGRMEEKLADLGTQILQSLLNIYKMVEPLVNLAGVGVDMASAGLAMLSSINSAATKLAALDFKGAAKALEEGTKEAQRLIERAGKDIAGALTGEELEFDDPFMTQWAEMSRIGAPRHHTAGQLTNRPRRVADAGRRARPGMAPGGA